MQRKVTTNFLMARKKVSAIVIQNGRLQAKAAWGALYIPTVPNF